MSGAETVLIGNRVHLAPLAGIADPAFRLVARAFGAGPLMTEMLSCHAIVRGDGRELAQQTALIELERPLAVQLVGGDPAMMAEAARRAAAAGADSININMACPARKIVKGDERAGKGAALMKSPDRARRIMAAVREAVRVPVTVKIRAGWDCRSINAVEFSRMAEGEGMAAVILHPRTREQAFSGRADWSLIEAVVRTVSIPVVGNGDIRTPDDAVRMFETTGCRAVMIGRGALGRPWLFALVHRRLAGEPRDVPPFPVDGLEAGEPAQLARLLRFQMELALRCKPGEVVAREMRKHLVWYSRGMYGSHTFRARLHTATDTPSLLALIDGFFRMIAEARK